MSLADPPALAVVGAVLVDHGRILACRRGPQTSLSGWWEFPGGKIEPGESPRDALRREILEELGVRIAVGGLVARQVTATATRPIDLACYWATCVEGELPTASTDHDALLWLEPAELPSLRWAPADVPMLDAITHGRTQI